MSELKAFVARKIDDGTCDPVPCIEVYSKSEADKAIARAKAEKQRMSVPHVIQWNSTKIQEFEFTKNINVEI